MFSDPVGFGIVVFAVSLVVFVSIALATFFYLASKSSPKPICVLTTPEMRSRLFVYPNREAPDAAQICVLEMWNRASRSLSGVGTGHYDLRHPTGWKSFRRWATQSVGQKQADILLRQVQKLYDPNYIPH